MKLLLIEDDAQLAHWLVQLLREQDFLVDHVADGGAADRLLAQSRYDVVLLDLNLPQLSGKGVLRRIRERQDDAAVIVLTASASLDQKVQCLEMGADDYLVKPIEVRELVARMQALLRRRRPGKANDITCGDLALPPRERHLLETLILHAGTTVSRQALVDGLFGIDEEASADAIDLYVHRLRKKLEASSTTIVTLRGVGFLLRTRQD